MQNHINKSEKEINEEKKEKDKSYWPYLLLLIILLFFCVFGITYSVNYGNGTSDSEIDTGRIIFTYSDIGQVGNGIFLTDAMPITDIIGKSMMGARQYFDFAVTASTDNANILYKILVNKDEQSTLEDSNVRLYLTQLMGSFEKEITMINVSDLKTENINGKNYYVLFEKELEKNLNNYNESYRLRMWLKQDATNFENKTFSIKVDVYAYQIER